MHVHLGIILNDLTKNILIWVAIAMMLLLVFQKFSQPLQFNKDVNYTQFIRDVKAKEIKAVDIQNQSIIVHPNSGATYATYAPPNDDNLINDLLAAGVEITSKPPEKRSLLFEILIGWAPFLLIIGLWIYIMRQMQGGGGKGGPMSFGKSRAKMMSEDDIKINFDDVAGCEEAKDDVTEVVDFLRDPSKFQKLGGKIPRGVLMVGSPGTGKTLLAKAIAGEAKVPFFSISGSDFVEMFVGVGASRVRDMFETAKKHAPCIIFIDEIDAVGRQRGAGVGGGHDEREQTLNQLLVEMDGFEGNDGVIVIAATNRPDVLDKALLRPGRFDRQVVVPLPDVRGREKILKVHMRKVPIGDDVKPKLLARGTPGFSGADLANLVNEAALFAARSDLRTVGMTEFEQAKDKIMMGAERKSMVMTEKEKKLTAYHEAGHAIVGLTVPDHDPVYKVSIIPRGRALGITMFLPEEDRYSQSKQHLESMLSSLYGGRVAEEIIYGSDYVTTGASNDIDRATEIARNMITKWGFSKSMGPLAYSEDEGEVFLGRSVTQHKQISDQTASTIDLEVRELVDRNYQRATDILNDKIDILHKMTDALMKYETIDMDQIKALMEGNVAPAPQGWDDDDDSSSAKPEPESKNEDTESNSDKKPDGGLDGAASSH